METVLIALAIVGVNAIGINILLADKPSGTKRFNHKNNK